MPNPVNIEFNSVYAPALDTRCRFIHLYGGRAGGRSFAAAQIMIKKMLTSSYFRGIIARQNFGSIRDSQFRQIVDIITDAGLTHLFNIHTGSMRISCKRNGNTIVPKGFKSSSNTSKAGMKSLTGVTDVWIEEAEEVLYEDWQKLNGSLRTVKGQGLRIYLTYNTEKGDHWLKTKHHDHPTDSMLFIHTTYKDNISNLDAGFLEWCDSLRKTDPEYARIWIDGEWGGGVKGRIFKHFKETSKEVEGNTVYGIDFGFNVPSAIVKVVQHDGQLYVYEHTYQSHLTNTDLIRLLADVNKSDLIFCDNAEPDRIEEIRRAGYNARKANKDVKYGIDLVKAQTVHVHSSAKNILKESKSYQWKEDTNGEPLDVPVKAFDHAMDALRYAVVGIVGKGTSKPKGLLRKEKYYK